MRSWRLAKTSLDAICAPAFALSSPSSSRADDGEDGVGGGADHVDVEAGNAHDATAAGQSTASSYGSFNNKAGSFNKQAMRSSLKERMQQQTLRILDLFRSWDEDGSVSAEGFQASELPCSLAPHSPAAARSNPTLSQGEIDRTEFRQAGQSMGFAADLAEIDAVFNEIDEDGSGAIEYHELSKVLRGGAGQNTLDAVMQPGAVGLGTTGVQHKLRKAKQGEAKMKGTKLGGAKLDLESEVPVAQQLRDILSANAARVVDLFREWCEPLSLLSHRPRLINHLSWRVARLRPGPGTQG